MDFDVNLERITFLFLNFYFEEYALEYVERYYRQIYEGYCLGSQLLCDEKGIFDHGFEFVVKKEIMGQYDCVSSDKICFECGEDDKSCSGAKFVPYEFVLDSLGIYPVGVEEPWYSTMSVCMADIRESEFVEEEAHLVYFVACNVLQIEIKAQEFSKEELIGYESVRLSIGDIDSQSSSRATDDDSSNCTGYDLDLDSAPNYYYEVRPAEVSARNPSLKRVVYDPATGVQCKKNKTSASR